MFQERTFAAGDSHVWISFAKQSMSGKGFADKKDDDATVAEFFAFFCVNKFISMR